uniref:Zinc finger protein 679-like n=1 Tax=Labrus bergylta TaxID=56723 RepID=A0A3Q3FH52_9LABR|nr:zinc finger protein 679-like [Labrus bergylta]
MELASVNCLKSFVSERLTVAAQEIFGVFEKTLFVYQEEIVRQRRLLDAVLKPDIKLQRTDVPQPPIGEERVLLDLESSTCLDQADPELQIKQEEEEVSTCNEKELFALHQDTEAFKFSPAREGSNPSEDGTLLLDPHQTPNITEQEPQSTYSDEWIQSEFQKTDADVNVDQHFPTGVEQYMCCICGKSFKMNSKLKLHMKIHTGEKLFCCMYCNKGFVFNSSLTRHLRVHTGEKPYECGLCGKRFNVSTTLKVHYRTHTGEKPYQCKMCEKAFTTCSNLKKHMSLHQ